MAWNLSPFLRRKRVAVVGLLQSGKTVLLTSLIDHLRNHSPLKVPLDNKGTQIVGHKERAPRTKLGRFPFKKIRAALGQRTWPEKTLAAAEYRSDNTRLTGKKRIHYDLSLFDFPGERLIDLIVADCKRYDDWSDRVLSLLGNDPGFQAAMASFQKCVNRISQESDSAVRDNLIREDAVREYKNGLFELCQKNAPVVTPSSFLITPQGQHVADTLKGVPENQWADKLAEHHPCGVSLNEEFVPLDKSIRVHNDLAIDRFRQNYAKYRKQVVFPFTRPLRGCDEILVLVDIPMLLRGGPDMLNSQREMLELFFDYVEPGFHQCMWPFQFVLPGVRQVTFLATKADRIPGLDHPALLNLLTTLARPIINAHRDKQFDVDFSICSAVASVRFNDPNNPRIPEWADQNNGHIVRAQLPVPQLPFDWPRNWDPQDYANFPDPDPWMPAARLDLPDQILLADVINKLLP